MSLPEAFTARMKHLLGEEEYTDFLASYTEARRQGLRVNRLKLSPQAFLKRVDWKLESVPWTEDGFYYSESLRPAKHPYYHAGLYYIQEPSAMSPAAVLDACPGERVLDLCAAPGGKTTQLAAAMQGQGILVTNDSNPNRVKALVKNVELYGIRNAVVTNETPDRLAKVFPGYFDKILVDAPCSGEGMFRKEPDMVKSWSEAVIETCCGMQRTILQDAARMLRPGGRLLYSTCTFAPEENERMIAEFLMEQPDFSIVPIPMHEGWEQGRPEWTQNAEANRLVSGTARLWPHRISGEGHYVALLQKAGDKESSERDSMILAKPVGTKQTQEKELADFYTFVKETLPEWKGLEDNGFILTMHEDRVFLSPQDLPGLQSLRLARQGWLLGTIKKKRFEPSQAFAMGLKAENAAQKVNFAPDESDTIRYLKGETLMRQAEKGWNLVCVDGFPLGWAKGAGGMLKNMYPAGWRWMDGA
ncbi:RsmF rRNA methyltransferase first C-terminal domain-containing protein [Aneurinibacillus danicus]|uniref:Methylase n=1 Tax=Aneurinibacillus danicus TaxID=267746 RepID=A0A511V7K7_9BACL|nr:RsmB/NOP family class I SAM-dependent RNA methyltransferase [Aneurinibacillus danicus]GEN34944.1 methylase [Aneurinibacillus danicus]